MKQIAHEKLRNAAAFLSPAHFGCPECVNAIAYCLKKIDGNLPVFTDRFPAPASVGGVYPATGNTEWTPGFWTGMLWLAYEASADETYRKAAEAQLESFYERVEKRMEVDIHDLGFLYTLSCVAACKLTGSTAAREHAVLAAGLLIERYFEKAGIIQAWGDLSDPQNRGRMIIDCCMNLPLLYWASRVTGEPRYYDAAVSHARRAADYLVRGDASTYHTFYVDVDTGKPKFGRTAQGYSDSSCWARGQAWAIYGFALSYLYTRDSRFLDISKKVANYFLNRLPADFVCYWDLVFTAGAEERDSSSAAIAACGLLELASHLPLTDPDRAAYEGAALHITRSLADGYTTKTQPASNGILLHAVYSKPDGKGVDECNIWGDYFYMEALIRLTRDWNRYW